MIMEHLGNLTCFREAKRSSRHSPDLTRRSVKADDGIPPPLIHLRLFFPTPIL